MSRASSAKKRPPRVQVPREEQQPSPLRAYSNVDDISWLSIAKDTWFPGIGNDYSSTFSLDPEEGQCTPVARWLKESRQKASKDPYDVSPPSYVQPGPPLVLKQDERERLRERFQARCDSPTPSEDTIVRLNRQDDTTPSYASRASSGRDTPDTTRSSGDETAGVPSTRPKNPSPPPSPTELALRGRKSLLGRGLRPSSYASTAAATSTTLAEARRGKSPSKVWRDMPSIPLVSNEQPQVRRKASSAPLKKQSRRGGGKPTSRSPEGDFEPWGPGLPFIADFLSNEPVLTRGGLRYHNRCPQDWYE